MKLNLGCGERYVEGWHNVDHALMPHRVDEVVDLTGELPWMAESVTAIYAGHVLEHLSLDACYRLLSRLWRCAVDFAPILVVGPDVDLAEAMTDEHGWVNARQGVSLAQIRDGANRWAGDGHLWRCTGEGLVDLLTDTDWSLVDNIGIDAVPDFWPVADRDQKWQCAVLAVK